MTRAKLWTVAAFAVASALALAIILYLGVNQNTLRIALRMTARFSFLLFWIVYAGGAVATLGGRRFALFRGRGREFGLAFASAQLVHLMLVLWLVEMIRALPLSVPNTIFFSLALTLTYVLAAFSLPRVRRALPPALWRTVMFLSVQCIALAFFADFVVGAVASRVEYRLDYLPFAVLIIAAPILRVAAWAHDLRQKDTRSVGVP